MTIVPPFFWIAAVLMLAAISFLCGRLTAQARTSAGETSANSGSRNRPQLAQEPRPFLAMFERYGTPFSMAMFGPTQSEEQGQEPAPADLFQMIAWRVRENDRVLQSDDGVVTVILPQTGLTDAATLVSRLRRQTEQDAGRRLAVGIVEALDGDFEESLERRTRQALSVARSSPHPIQIQDGVEVHAWNLDLAV
jgi:hypothetical protein